MEENVLVVLRYWPARIRQIRRRKAFATIRLVRNRIDTASKQMGSRVQGGRFWPPETGVNFCQVFFFFKKTGSHAMRGGFERSCLVRSTSLLPRFFNFACGLEQSLICRIIDLASASAGALPADCIAHFQCGEKLGFSVAP